jgi:hypothetical protein
MVLTDLDNPGRTFNPKRRIVIKSGIYYNGSVNKKAVIVFNARGRNHERRRKSG